MEFWILAAVTSAFLGVVVGSPRNAALTGFVFGLLFGPLGVLVTLAFDYRAQCPRCHGRINGSPEICQHCRSPLRDRSASAAAAAPRTREITRCPVCAESLDSDAPRDGARIWCTGCHDFVVPIRA